MTLWEEIEIIRGKLIDMTLVKNKFNSSINLLLSFKSNSLSLEITDEAPADVYQALVKNKEKMTFLELPDKTHDGLSDNISEVSDTGSKLQTTLTRSELDSRFIHIEKKVNECQKKGVDVLFLALGFLAWYDSKDSKIKHEAPLLLIPVELDRSKSNIQYTGVDIRTNRSIKIKLWKDFRIELPDISNDFDFNSYMDLVEKSITDAQPTWSIKRNDIRLGFFSFKKLRMYEDIDPKHWDDGSKRDVLERLFGSGGDTSVTDSDTKEVSAQSINDTYHKLHLIMDADYFQTDAIIASKTEKALVIHGPPGTGKSQTIANIIGEALSDGKKVLFVAENKPALDVVKRRLDECQLGPAVLELHNPECKEWEVTNRLKHTLDTRRPGIKNARQDRGRYDNLKKELDEYEFAVNKPLLNTEFSYFHAIGHFLTTNKDKEPNTLESPFESMRNWTDEDYNETYNLVKEIVEHLEETAQKTGVPISKSVFNESKLQIIIPLDKNNLKKKLHDLFEQIQRMMNTTRDLTDDVRLDIPLHQLQKFVSWISAAPDVMTLNFTQDYFTKNQLAISELLEAGQVMEKIKKNCNEQLTEQGWSVDLSSTREILKNMRDKWWRILSREYRQAKANARSISANKTIDMGELFDLVDSVCIYQTKRRLFDKHSSVGREAFGDIWNDMSSDWGALTQLFDWVAETYKQISNGDLPKEAMSLLTKNQSKSYSDEHLASLSKDIYDILDKTPEVRKDLGFITLDCGENHIYSLYKDVKRWHDDLEQLSDSIKYNFLKGKLKDKGLIYLADLCDDWPDVDEPLITSFTSVWFGGLIREAYKSRPILQQFTRIGIENKVNEFKKLDKELFSIAQETIVEKHRNGLPNSDSEGEMTILKREMLKKTNKKSLRRLLTETGRTIQQIKPVFMMSPLSVAAYLAPNSVDFDLLIFDEASQIRVEDAIGSMLRAKQVVVVGDEQQMPPTDFSKKDINTNNDDDSVANGIDSILKMFLIMGRVSEKMLRSHYRSRHPSLISTSNKELYNNKLQIFPTPGTHPVAEGLSLKYNPDNIHCGDGLNPQEAREIAEAVMDHAKHNEDLSLGVIAFAWPQMKEIEKELSKLGQKDPLLTKFINKKRPDGEDFFVINLERVQGDERDVIFISVSFGRGKNGEVKNFFGAINYDGGERRLNVMLTRAKFKMVVFSNFLSDDLKENSETPHGPRAMKSLLHFAKEGEHQNEKTEKPPGSEFEVDVINVIRRLGFEVTSQMGSAEFFIDICVKHPEKPGQYVLAIECDGANCHSLASTRDRDRLRQEILEGFGWKFHRIWSTDWFQNRADEVKRLGDAIKTQIARSTPPEKTETHTCLATSDEVKVTE